MSYFLNSIRALDKLAPATTKRISPICNQIFERQIHEIPTKKKAEQKAAKVLDSVHAELIAQRFKDIVVIETRHDADPRYMVLASAFNDRHLLRGTEAINKFFKQSIRGESDEFAKLSISHEWNVVDLKSVVIHLFAKDCRDYFDIEQLWAVGEKYDNLIKQYEKDVEASKDELLAAPIATNSLVMPGSNIIQ